MEKIGLQMGPALYDIDQTFTYRMNALERKRRWNSQKYASDADLLLENPSEFDMDEPPSKAGKLLAMLKNNLKQGYDVVEEEQRRARVKLKENLSAGRSIEMNLR